MIIQPIVNIKSFEEIAKASKPQALGTENQIPFKNMFQDAVSDVYETNAAVQEEVIKAATSDTDDLQNLGIASAKAGLAMDMVIQIRNKALDAYNEIMRMGV